MTTQTDQLVARFHHEPGRGVAPTGIVRGDPCRHDPARTVVNSWVLTRILMYMSTYVATYALTYVRINTSTYADTDGKTD